MPSLRDLDGPLSFRCESYEGTYRDLYECQVFGQEETTRELGIREIEIDSPDSLETSPGESLEFEVSDDVSCDVFGSKLSCYT